MLALGSSSNEFSTDYSMFNKTYEVQMPTCSAMFYNISRNGSAGNTPILNRTPDKQSEKKTLKNRVKNIMMMKNLSIDKTK